MWSGRVRVQRFVLVLVREVLRRRFWAFREGGIVGIRLRKDNSFSTLDNDRGPDRNEGIKSKDTKGVSLEDSIRRKEPFADGIRGDETTAGVVIEGGERFQNL